MISCECGLISLLFHNKKYVLSCFHWMNFGLISLLYPHIPMPFFLIAFPVTRAAFAAALVAFAFSPLSSAPSSLALSFAVFPHLSRFSRFWPTVFIFHSRIVIVLEYNIFPPAQYLSSRPTFSHFLPLYAYARSVPRRSYRRTIHSRQ